ncbi:MAG TPA: O-antigen ligase family protein, partial [Patescibacteria group bacterium]|nr:O-antigen ligase family protein [Patescibacteria group bacterium]
LKPDFGFLKNDTHLFLLLFITFNALSVTNSGLYLNKSLSALSLKWCKYLFIFIVVENTLSTQQRLRNAIFVVLFIGMLIGLDTLSQQFFNIDFIRHRPLIDGRVTATFENRNSLAVYLVPTALVITAFALGQTKRRFLIPLSLAILLLGASLILTFSRSAWLGFFVGLTMILIMSYVAKKRTVAIYSASMILVFVISLLLVPAVRQKLIFTLSPGGDAFRIPLGLTAIKMIQENPFLGKGVGTFMSNFLAHSNIGTSEPFYAHNCFLQIWAETGIFSLLSFLAFAGLIVYQTISAFKKSSEFLCLGLACAIVGYLVNSFFEVSLYSLQLAFLFWLFMGLAGAAINAAKANTI